MEETVFYPLTHAQKRIWYTEVIHPNSSINNIGGPITFNGMMDVEKINLAINGFIKNNDALRIRIVDLDGEVQQYFAQYVFHQFDYFDFSDQDSPKEAFNQWVQKEMSVPFAILNSQLYYFAIYKINENSYGYLAKFNHIIADGWSIQLMSQQIILGYKRIISGETTNEEEIFSYSTYINEELKYVKSKRFAKDKEYWIQRFTPLPELPKSSLYFSGGNRISCQLDTKLFRQIKGYVQEIGSSTNAFFVTALKIYLYLKTDNTDSVIGIPVANRGGKDLKCTVGMFTSTIPLLSQINTDKTYSELIIQTQIDISKDFFHQKYPYDLLIRDLEVTQKSNAGLFDISVNYYNTKLVDEYNGYKIENEEIYSGEQLNSLDIIIKEWSDTFDLLFDYKTGNYSDNDIKKLVEELTLVIKEMVCFPNNRITKSKDSRGEINPLNNTIFDLFEEQVLKTPDRTAITFGLEEVSYSELNRRTNSLANYLVKIGIRKGNVLGIRASHGIDAIICIMAAIKAGFVYVPIDVNYPVERVQYILDNSNAVALLTNSPGQIGDIEIPIINVKILNLNVDDSSFTTNKIDLDDLVYIMYTSGSTGNPKGAMIQHRGLVNYITWAKKVYVGDSETEIFPLYSSLAFDLTVTSIFTPLISGNKIHVYANQSDEQILNKILQENIATIIKLTPSHLKLISEASYGRGAVKKFIVGGEDLKVELAKRIHDNYEGKIEIFNEYGPTETVVGCMIHKYEPNKDIGVSVPIGIPADNVQIYLLNESLQPVDIHSEGEIYIAGLGVGLGYVNRPDLTNERFVNNPFTNNTKMYKTGDIARFIHNGKLIEYIGRTDQQVKINGYRIELGEIESAISLVEGVRDVLVTSFKTDFEFSSLCAFIDTDKEISNLKELLSKSLPAYMVPEKYVYLDGFPRTTNGKKDQNKMIRLIKFKDQRSSSHRTEDNKLNLLMEVLGEVLHQDEINLNDNFYNLGGDSIKAISVSSRLLDKGVTLSVKDILLNPVLGKMAVFMQEINGSQRKYVKAEGYIETTPIISWFLSRNLKNPSFYNQTLILNFKQRVSRDLLEQVWVSLMERHEILKCRYDPVVRKLYYDNSEKKEYFLREVDLPISSEKQDIELILDNLCQEMAESIDIVNGSLFDIALVDIGNRDMRLLLTIHHLIIDGVSWRILLEHMDHLLAEAELGELYPEIRFSSYQEYALLKARKEESNKIEFFEKNNNQICPIPEYDMSDDTYGNSITITSKLTREETSRLLQVSNLGYRTSVEETLLICLSLCGYVQFKTSRLNVNVEGHGRDFSIEGMDIGDTIGWFTSIKAIELNVEKADIYSNITPLKEQIRTQLRKSEFSFNSKAITFNYMGDINYRYKYFELGNTMTHIHTDPRNKLTSMIEINSMIIRDELMISLTFSPGRDNDKRMEKFMNYYVTCIQQFIQHCELQTEIIFSPSDFDMVSLSQKELDSLFIKGC
ncbi:amino acid adenylation domain-containing protein/non-ribosomal peptide synthase protein (TIGR01720 family) [Paenibacillus sp. JGP012]|uniref:non-ribosomal peptide synthetase n=1 Tax=Paenibacillus sp. JGP012 TaxID=2735914 RepID=UPI00161F9FBA|nr:non-ribosomal peptide synthetase [Paenibacillus sp. JGP012]MBB6022757.1 amino acid adenylation domain-containing protein/non-ribosomal peptide synthase protein (TIGR01720 family) [Paenibacillus sp. JGP012]